MQQTALNLIAVGVFVITFSTLLSPLFHISPFVPAAFTVGIMGLLTLDTLSWRNQGVTLLLDRFTPLSERKRIVQHEAGHFLAAYYLGIPILGYTLTAWETFKQGQGGLAGVICDTQTLAEKGITFREAPLLIERFSTVWMAGIAAEAFFYGKAQGGADDRQKLQATLKLSGLPESIYAQKERWALLQAKNLLEAHQDAYQALVEAMEQRASVAECCRILQQLNTGMISPP